MSSAPDAKTEATALLSSLRAQYQQKFENYKKIHMNPGTKGFELEKVVADILNDYLGSIFDIHTRAEVIDNNMEYLKLFVRGTDEIDIVAVHKNVVPKIVLKIGDTSLVPYDGVAFVMEVKSTMSKPNLEKDLQKLDKLAKLPLTPSRFGATVGGTHALDRPLRTIFYFDQEIDQGVMNQLLLQFKNSWDCVFISRTDEIIINDTLPLYKILVPQQYHKQPLMSWGGNAFIVLLLILSSGIQIPLSANVIKTLLAIHDFAI